MKSNALILLVGLIALAGLVVGLVALQRTTIVRELALSEIVVEEANSLSSPVFHEESNTYSYLALYDISIANMSGPAVTLERVKKSRAGAGFLTLLKEKDIVSFETQEKAFISEQGSAAIKSNPRLLKAIGQQDMGEASDVNLQIAPGETKVIHVGLTLEPYGAEMRALANMGLVSFELEFNNGKRYVFQRGFPIYPIRQ
jgi:hypothetical protein